MSAFLRPFIDLLLFRGKAQDIPASSTLLGATAIAALLADIFSSLSQTGLSTAFVLAASQIVALAGFLKLLFALHQKSERWLQSTTALLGCLAILNAASIPFSGGIVIDPAQGMTLNTALLAIGLLQLWFFVVQVRVLMEALEIGVGRAILLGFLLSYGIAMVVVGLFGHLLPAAPTAAG